MYGELGRVPNCIQCKIQMITYWAKIRSKPETTILYKTYNMLKTNVDIGCTDSNNWAYQIKLILDRSGFFKHLATTTNLSIYSKSYKDKDIGQMLSKTSTY